MFIYLITPENPHEHPVITAVAFEDDIINYFTALTEVNRDTVDAHHYAVYRMAVFIYRYYESKRYDVGVYDQTPSREFSNFLTAQNANHTVYYQIVHFNGLEKPAQLLKRFLGETRSYDSFTPFMVDNMDNVFLRKKHLILNPEVMKDINKKYKQYTKKKDKTAIVVYSNSPHYLKLAAQGKRFPTIGEHFRCMQSYQYPGCTFDNPYTPKDLLPVGSSVPQMATNSWTPVIAGAAFVGVLGFGLYKAYRYFYPAQKSLKKPKETKETKETKEVPAKTTRKKVSRRGSETSAIEDSTESYPVPDEKTINWEELEQKYATIYRKTKEMLISNAKYSAAKNILDKTEVALKEIDNTYRKTKKTKENFKKISQLVIRLQELNNQSRQELSELRNDLTTLHKDRIDKSNRYLTREYWGLSAAPADEKKETPVAPSQKTVFTASDLKAATASTLFAKKVEEKKLPHPITLTRRENVLYVLPKARQLLDKFKMDFAADEKQMIKILHKKFVASQLTFGDKLAIKFALESVLIEFCLNGRIGKSNHDQWDFRNTALYRKFNEDNLTLMKILQESSMTDEDHEKVTALIVELLKGLQEYLQLFDNDGRIHFDGGTPTSPLLAKLTETSLKTRDIFSHQIFADGERKAHTDFANVFEELLETGVLSDCKWLSQDEKLFAETYGFLRMVSESGKVVRRPQDPLHQLANQWRHGARLREEVTQEVVQYRQFQSLTLRS